MGNKYYNSDTEERLGDAKILDGNPNGIISKSETPHTWAVSLWTLSIANNWFPSECGIKDDAVMYSKLCDEQRDAYDKALSQIMVNDSIQAPQIVDAISKDITSPMVKACLTRQSFEETNHALTYDDMANEICNDPIRLYTLEQEFPDLYRKNKAVTDMYAKLNSSDKPTLDDKMLGYTANQILEELVFPGSFLTLWSFNFTGTNLAIGFIERDESTFHVPLFRNIFRTVLREKNLTISDTLYKKMTDLILHMTNEEKLWLKSLTKNLLGFSDAAIDMFVENKANSICENLKLDYMFTKTDGGPLEKTYRLYSKASKDGTNTVDTKTDFFETTVIDYAKGVLDEDY